MIDLASGYAEETTAHSGWWPSRRMVAWSALLLNLALWAAIISAASTLAAAL